MKKMQFKSISIVANTITIGNIPFRSIKQIFWYTVSLLYGKKQQNRDILFSIFTYILLLMLIYLQDESQAFKKVFVVLLNIRYWRDRKSKNK